MLLFSISYVVYILGFILTWTHNIEILIHKFSCDLLSLLSLILSSNTRTLYLIHFILKWTYSYNIAFYEEISLLEFRWCDSSLIFLISSSFLYCLSFRCYPESKCNSVHVSVNFVFIRFIYIFVCLYEGVCVCMCVCAN